MAPLAYGCGAGPAPAPKANGLQALAGCWIRKLPRNSAYWKVLKIKASGPIPGRGGLPDTNLYGQHNCADGGTASAGTPCALFRDNHLAERHVQVGRGPSKVAGHARHLCRRRGRDRRRVPVHEVGQDAWLDAALSNPAVTDAQVQGMERMAPMVGYFTVASMFVALPLISAIVAGILFAIFNAALGGNATFKQVFTVVVHAGAIGVLAQLFVVPLNYFRGTMTSATNFGVLLPMMPEGSFGGAVPRHDRHLHHLAVHRSCHRPCRALSPPHTAGCDVVAGRLSRHCGHCRVLRPGSW